MPDANPLCGTFTPKTDTCKCSSNESLIEHMANQIEQIEKTLKNFEIRVNMLENMIFRKR